MILSTEEEVALIEKAQADDMQSFEKLVEIYTPYVKSLARRYFLIGGELEDIIQIGLMGLCVAIRKYDKSLGTSFKTFVNMVVLSDIKNEITKSQNTKNRMLAECMSLELNNEDDDAWVYVPESADKSPEEQLIQKQKIKTIICELNQSLNAQEKKILSMYLKGFKYAEIAEKIDSTTKRVDNTLTKAKKILQKLKKEESL